ncbi:MAG: alpha-galactosidase [Planctomycetes bacterium]|nr:alpha-galactosidase [Planctomycetota bacterium]
MPAGGTYDASISGREVLTPPPPAAPRIHAPAVYGARPGRPMIFRIPTTGKRPIAFSASGLPESIQLDKSQGILTGTTPTAKGNYRITLRAANATGRDEATMTLVVGDKLALTPPMGWNSWYTHYRHVTDKIIRQAADAMVESGMADVGYSYVSIDDCWMRMADRHAAQQKKRLGKRADRVVDLNPKAGPPRDAKGNILPARDFPDMKALTDHIHAYGLKAGIYTSPGPRTCAGFEGAYGHEAQDAKTFADWGFDLLKYDWCSYGSIYKKRMAGSKDPDKARAEHRRPYEIMGKILAGQRRDIVLNLCQYGMDSVWEWGEQVGGQSWRIGGDLGFSLTRGGVYRTAKKTIGIRRYNGPGHWNDPDYVILGNWVPGANAAAKPRPVNLAPGEQYSYMSLWCLMACPLFFSGDMATIDDFTYGLLCNPEMIAVNQDRLGICAEPVVMDAGQWVLKKPLADGSLAIGLFNLDRKAGRTIAVTWAQLGLDGARPARDLWRQRDVTFPPDGMRVKLGPLGCAVFKIGSR